MKLHKGTVELLNPTPYNDLLDMAYAMLAAPEDKPPVDKEHYVHLMVNGDFKPLMNHFHLTVVWTMSLRASVKLMMLPGAHTDYSSPMQNQFTDVDMIVPSGFEDYADERKEMWIGQAKKSEEIYHESIRQGNLLDANSWVLPDRSAVRVSSTINFLQLRSYCYQGTGSRELDELTGSLCKACEGLYPAFFRNY